MAVTVAINPTPPTAPQGEVRTGAAGVDMSGNIWLFFPRFTISGTTTGGWLYAATVTGGLPAGAEAPTQETP